MPEAVHYGPVAANSGGIAQVVAAYRQAPTGQWSHSVRPTAGGGRVSEIVGWCNALWCLVTHRSALHVFHLSQRGSFLREGTLIVLAAALQVRRAAMIHGSGFEAWAARAPRLTGFVVRRSHRVLVLTEQASAVVTRLGGRAELVPNIVQVPVDTPWSAKSRTVIFAGVVGRRKGVDTLLAAWAQSTLRKAGWDLTICGPLEDYELEPLLRSSGVEWRGEVHHEDLLHLLDRAAVVVLPSRAEALPMSLLEGMARGCIPVGTSVGRVQDLVSSAGLSVMPGDVDALRRALDELATEDLAALEDRGTHARQRIQDEFDYGRGLQRLQQVWAEAWGA